MFAGGDALAAEAKLLAEVPLAPRTPSKRAREIIFRYQGSQKVMLLLGGIFLVVGVIMTTVFCWGLSLLRIEPLMKAGVVPVLYEPANPRINTVYVL
jgi:hypothetical protein